jgi:hypothetical protein
LGLTVRGASVLVRAAPLLVVAALAPGVQVKADALPNPVLLRDNLASVNTLTAPTSGSNAANVWQPDTEIEPSIAANPADPLNAVSGFQMSRRANGGDLTNGFATTHDGGKTWTTGPLPCLTRYLKSSGCPDGGMFDRASDASVAFGPNNTVEYNSLVFDMETGHGLHSGIANSVSHDGGTTWSLPAIIQMDNDAGLNDKNWTVVDNGTGAGHKTGRVYAVWDRVVEMIYNFCDQNCESVASWSSPEALPFAPGQGIGSFPVVLTDGSLAVFYEGANQPPPIQPGEQPSIGTNQNIAVVLFPMAGGLPGPALVTAPPIGVATNATNGVRHQRAGSLIAADVDPASNQLYVVWEDGRFRTEPGAVVNDAVFSTSTDGGMTWSVAKRINPGPENDYVNRYNVAVAVGSDGVVHVMYRQRQEDADAQKDGSTFSPVIDTYYQESRDHGATWSVPLKVNTGPSSFYSGAFSRGGLFQGDYNDLATSGPYTYVARDESYPLNTGEQPSMRWDAGSTAYVLNTPSCGKTIRSACLTHLHQRTWVAVIGHATPPPAPVQSGGSSGVPLTAPEKSLALVGWLLGLVTVLLFFALVRKRNGGAQSGQPRREQSRR